MTKGKIAQILWILSSRGHNILKRFRESGEMLDGHELRALRQHCTKNRFYSVVEISAWARECSQKLNTASTNAI